ncbi:hypothetical protein BU15DRAFT_78039 [Melanogaster broomeanus]|nr:hypothetical protein BU15DRAFT_78039 [Melanogaster broomeanus]
MNYGEDVTNTSSYEDSHLTLQQCQSDYKVLVDLDVNLPHTDSHTPHNNYDTNLATPSLSQSINDTLPQTITLTKISPSTGTQGNTLDDRPNITLKTRNTSTTHASGPSATATSINSVILHGTGNNSAPD